jgi:hypothetical protein
MAGILVSHLFRVLPRSRLRPDGQGCSRPEAEAIPDLIRKA